MSTFQQFFPGGGGGSGGSTKMDLEVLILSGGGGAAISSCNCTSACRESGLGGGGAVFVGSVPVTSGCTVPVVVGAGGAGASGEAITTNQNGTKGGSSSITTPEGTLCVAGGGAGGHTAQCAFGTFPPSCPPSTYVWNGGTGGTGGYNCSDPAGCPNCLTFQICGACIAEGARSMYSTGSFVQCEQYYGAATLTCQIMSIFYGPHQINHKYGTFMGGSGMGGRYKASTTACFFNGQASGGAGGHATQTPNQGASNQIVRTAGKGYCSDITGTLETYGRGVTHIPASCMPVLGCGGANTGRGGSVGGTNNGCACSGSGGSGVVVIRYPDQFAAAPASPGATDCSPVTPGYYTYRFNSTGSITLP